ncbi:hypothetical protein IFM89_033008 [Coptis chinensis]|uniref:HRDC domain-containing protein n=1 Tax=Coptis chinensis TaxID=261450 RepID=A0A835II18_9MAGN|nr:hypothetical protein IFM89_033008 [Coptis chinensis]
MLKRKEEDGFEVGEGRKKNYYGKEKKMMAFHLASIPKPQDEFNIFVNNSNQPFEHVWLQRTDDGTRPVHPLEKLSGSDFVDKNVGSIEPVKSLPLENTPFKLVEEVRELKHLAAKLRSVDEFAVDLEHNQYRSFQGLTCLMQISTRTEDYVIDTLKLRVHIGPYLRDVFKDPSKRKVMHGADRDIVWLQRDFGIYVCNLFDTHQASRVLDLERNSLEYLLLYFCGVIVNKDYQNADWRLRPLPDDMLKYAREDTHYLLYMYDLMRRRLFSASIGSKEGNDLLLEGTRGQFQLSTNFLLLLVILQGLCEWRDAVARAEDESTGYILPNKTILEIARQMPVTVSKLRRLVKSKHPYVEVNLDSIVDIIKSSIRNGAAFESVAQQLQERRQEIVTEHNVELTSTVLSQPEKVDGVGGNRANEKTIKCLSTSGCVKEENSKLEGGTVQRSRAREGSYLTLSHEGGENKNDQVALLAEVQVESISISGQEREKAESYSAKAVSGATVEVLNETSHVPGREYLDSELKFDAVSKGKVEQIKSSVFPCNLSMSNSEQLKPLGINNQEIPSPKISNAMPTGISNLEDMASLGADLADQEPLQSFPAAVNSCFSRRHDADARGSALNAGEHTVSLSTLSTRFLKSFKLNRETRKTRQVDDDSQLRAFDCSAATKQTRVKLSQEEEMLTEGNQGFKSLLSLREGCNGSIISRFRKDEVTKDFQQAKEYQTFLHAGNQSFG